MIETADTLPSSSQLYLPEGGNDLTQPVSIDTSTTKRFEAVFAKHGVSKVYRMGEVQVHALRSVDLELFKVSLQCFWALPAAASQRCYTGWARRPYLGASDLPRQRTISSQNIGEIA
jgi:hypothetical protein